MITNDRSSRRPVARRSAGRVAPPPQRWRRHGIGGSCGGRCYLDGRPGAPARASTFVGPAQCKPAPIGKDVGIGRYITPDTIRLAVSGVLAGLAAALVWRAAGRTRWGPMPILVAVLAAAAVTHRFDEPGRYLLVAAGAFTMVLAAAGAVRFLANSGVHWTWVGVAALLSAAGVWAAVPETGPALVVGGTLVGLVAAGVLTGARWAPGAGVGVAAALGWAALSGAADRPWAALGGAMCTGVAPWLALRPVLPTPRWSGPPHPWFLAGHLALVIASARWVAIDPRPDWGRVAAVAVGGALVAMAYRPRA